MKKKADRTEIVTTSRLKKKICAYCGDAFRFKKGYSRDFRTIGSLYICSKCATDKKDAEEKLVKRYHSFLRVASESVSSKIYR